MNRDRRAHKKEYNMASNESNREEEEEQQFDQAFGNTQLGIRVKRIRNNDPDLCRLSLDRRDSYILSDRAWGLIGRYIANNNYLKSIYIYSSLCDSKASKLFDALAGGGNRSSLKVINLRENNFGIAGVRRLVPFLQNCQNLSEINLSANNNIDTAVFEVLANALNGSPIEELSLNLCSIDDLSALGNCSLPLLETLQLEKNSLQSIAALENYTNLQTLYLSGNDIGIDGCRSLSYLLQNEDSSLHTLDIDNNEIDDEGVEIITHSLKHNTKLELLNLDGNDNITQKGFTAFLKLLVDVSSIVNTYKNSNHTLTDLTLPSDEDDEDDNDDDISMYIDVMLEKNRGDNPGRRKVIDYQLDTDITELANLQGVPCTTNSSIYAQIDPVVLPDVLAIVGKELLVTDMYGALVTTASDLMSLVNKPAVLKERMNDKRKQIAEYNQKIGVLNAEINELNEELQSMSTPSVSNDDMVSDSGKKKRRRDS